MKKIFNSKLYKDGIRQLKMQGIILALLTLVMTAVPIIIQLISIAEYASETEGILHYATHLGMHMSLLFFMFIGGYILPYCTFRYLNKRNASDVYDSLPNTRTCTFLSLACSVFTWIAVLVFVNILLQFLMSFIFNGGHMAVWGTFKYFLFYFMGTSVVASGTMLGMSLTGTAFTNFVATGLVICLPRAVITLFEGVAVLVGEIITLSGMPNIFSPANNFVMAVPFSLFFNYSFDYIVCRWQGFVYTFLLFAVIFALANISFVKRKSETAGKPTQVKITQIFFRCSLSFPFLAMFFALIIGKLYDGAYCFVLMVIAIFVYFLYEAVTSKSIKNVVKSIPSFLIVIAITALITYLGSVCGNQIRKEVPLAEDVENVEIKTSAGSFSIMRDESYDYYGRKVSKIEYDDEDTIKCTLDILSENADKETYNSMSYNTTRDFIIKLKNGRTVVREVKITDEMIEKLDKCRRANAEYKRIYSTLPTASEVFNIVVNYKNLSFEFDDIEKFMSVFAEDAAKNGIKTCNYTSGIMVNVSGTENNRSFYVSYDVTKKNPELVKYIKSELTGKKASDAVKSAKTDYDNGELSAVTISLSEYDYSETDESGEQIIMDRLYFDSDTSKDNYEKLFSVMENSLDNTDMRDNAVTFCYYNKNGDEKSDNNMIFVSDEDLETLINISSGTNADSFYNDDATTETVDAPEFNEMVDDYSQINETESSQTVVSDDQRSVTDEETESDVTDEPFEDLENTENR